MSSGVISPQLKRTLLERLSGCNKNSKARSTLEAGFTLIELMIVVVILGILSAIAIPNLLANRDRAAAQSLISSMASFARQCSTNMLQESPAPINAIPSTITTSPAAVSGEVDCGSIDTTTGVWTPGNAGANITFANTTPGFSQPANLEGMVCGVAFSGAITADQRNDGTETTCTFTVEGSTTGGTAPGTAPSVVTGRVTGIWS